MDHWNGFLKIVTKSFTSYQALKLGIFFLKISIRKIHIFLKNILQAFMFSCDLRSKRTFYPFSLVSSKLLFIHENKTKNHESCKGLNERTSKNFLSCSNASHICFFFFFINISPKISKFIKLHLSSCISSYYPNTHINWRRMVHFQSFFHDSLNCSIHDYKFLVFFSPVLKLLVSIAFTLSFWGREGRSSSWIQLPWSGEMRSLFSFTIQLVLQVNSIIWTPKYQLNS